MYRVTGAKIKKEHVAKKVLRPSPVANIVSNIYFAGFL